LARGCAVDAGNGPNDSVAMLIMWLVFGILAMMWSVLCWALWAVAGAGGSATLGMAKLLQIDPLELVWLADTLDAVGGVAQWLVLLFWAVGMGLLLLLGWMTSRGARVARDAITEARIAAGDPAAGRSPALEGEVRSRKIEQPPALPGGD